MSDEQIDPTGQEDVKDQAPTSQGQADQAVTANSEQATTESTTDVRDDLVKQLMQAPVEEQQQEEPESASTDENDTEDDDAEGEPEAKKSEETESPVAEEGADLESHEKLGERTKKTITSLRQKAAFGDLITQTIKGKLSPEEFARWTGIATRLKDGDLTAVDELVATAKAFGYKEPTAPQPKQQTVDDIAEEIYKAEFAAAVEDLQIAEPLARKQARKLAEYKAPKQETAPAPKPVDNQQVEDPIRKTALQEIERLEREYRAANKDYDKVAKNVTERLVKEYGAANPIHWIAGYQNIVRDELRKASPPPAPKKEIKPVAGTQIRPTSTATQKTAPADPREELAQQILKGAFARR